jgi:hypothetical protein
VILAATRKQPPTYGAEHETEEPVENLHLRSVSDSTTDDSDSSWSSSRIISLSSQRRDQQKSESTTEEASNAKSLKRKKFRLIASKVQGLMVPNKDRPSDTCDYTPINFVDRRNRMDNGKQRDYSLAIDESPPSPLESWDDTAWKAKKRKVPSTEKQKDTGAENRDETHGSKFLGSSDKFTYWWDQNTAVTREIIKNGTVPKQHTIQRKIYKRMKQPDEPVERWLHRHLIKLSNSHNSHVNISLVESNNPLGKESHFSPYILYRWLRVRLAAGFLRSSFTVLHQLLKKDYDNAQELLKMMDNDLSPEKGLGSLLAVRDRLAGIWCVYAHFTLEAGRLLLAEEGGTRKFCEKRHYSKKAKATSKRSADHGCLKKTMVAKSSASTRRNELRIEEPELNNPRHGSEFVTNNVSLQEVVNYALSILLTARECPLVGSHTDIGVSLGRMIVSCTAVENTFEGVTRIEMLRAPLLAKIRSAISACWDGIDMCQGRLDFSRRFVTDNSSIAPVEKLISGVDLRFQKVQNEKRISRSTLQSGLELTLELPGTLRGIYRNGGQIIGDRNTIRLLLAEVNRWSRLEESLETNPHDTLKLSPRNVSGLSFLAEQMPLYSPLEILPSDTHLFKCGGDRSALIIWEW